MRIGMIDVGMMSDANALAMFLANHMDRPEDQMRCRWHSGDLAM